MTRRIVAVIAACGLLAQNAAFARQGPAAMPTQLEIAWDELAPLVVDKHIATVLPDGAKLEGDVLAVRPEALVLDVQKSSRKKLHPLGQTEIARPDVREVRVIRHTGAAFRLLGGIMGGIGGAFAAGGLAYASNAAAAVFPAFLLLIPLSATAGYYAGKLADRRITRISIRPAPAGGEEE